ncbi:MAG: carboxy-S-adenosyl-L-methionine synthase CmoA [Terriglobales bacterium]
MKKRDKVFRGGEKPARDFEFNAEVAEVFDDMLERSVPFYPEQLNMVTDIGKRFWIPGTRVYDLGCSTATMLIGLSEKLPSSARLIGYDNSLPMIEHARQKIARKRFQERIKVCLGELNGALSDIPLENASVVTMCWTLQFIRPLGRDNLIRRIYESLANEGALIVTEKILTNNGHVNRFFIDFYYDYKRKRGYSDTEIARKREALENVLIPYQLNENLDLFRRNGFEIVETLFQWFNFAGFLCVKKPAS